MQHTPLIPAFRRQRQADLCQLSASLVYILSSRTARAIEQDYILEKKEGREEKEQLVLGTQHISC